MRPSPIVAALSFQEQLQKLKEQQEEEQQQQYVGAEVADEAKQSSGTGSSRVTEEHQTSNASATVNGRTKNSLELKKKKSAPKATELLSISPRELSTIKSGEILSGIISAVTEASIWVDVGVFREIPRSDDDLLNSKRRREVAGRIGRRYVKDMRKLKEGRQIETTVKEAYPASARLELRLWNKRGGGGSTSDSMKRRIKGLEFALEDIEVGETILEGFINKLMEDVALIDVGAYCIRRGGKKVSVLGYLQRKHLKEGHALASDHVIKDNVTKVYRRNDPITVHVRAVHLANGYLRVSETPVGKASLLKEARESDKRRIIKRRRKEVSTVSPGMVRTGKISAKMDYGAFVDVGLKRDGLIYWQDMGEYKRDWKNDIRVGDEVVVDVLKVEGNRLNVALLKKKDDESEIQKGLEQEKRKRSDESSEGSDRQRMEQSFDDTFSDDYLESKYL